VPLSRVPNGAAKPHQNTASGRIGKPHRHQSNGQATAKHGCACLMYGWSLARSAAIAADD
jgi:hypothetical protein